MVEYNVRDRAATESVGSPRSIKASNDNARAKTEDFGSTSPGSPTPKHHQRFVLTDPVALKYLQEDPHTELIGTPQRLEGYECYLVEQWACSRTHPTFIITTFTGDRSHSVLASVLSVPINEESWSPRLKVYFKALDQYHARRRETRLGTLMVTNITAFPSSLTVIPIPDGDPKSHREDFIVNENLKRLGCSGRTGISLTKPTGATQAKFYQLYRTSEKIDLYKAVVELVKLCQVALTLFDALGAEYADGLLCDFTEKAINDWWIEIGNDLYNVEPQDGVLAPTTVAAILGTLIGARNRLSAYGASTSKDVFDVEATKRAIAYFQKSQRMPKTRRLDRATLKRLHSATAKAATSEGWMVPRVMKSTVAELGGKGGEMVMEMVGAKDKAGIAEVETVDIEQFVQLVRGERAKWLWYGKPRKAASGDMFDLLPAGPDGGTMEFKSDEHGRFTWQGTRKDSSAAEPATPGGLGRSSMDTNIRSNDTGDDERARHHNRLGKRQQPMREDGKRGIGKFRNAVGLRGHHHKHGILEEDVGPRHTHDPSSRQSPSTQDSEPPLPVTGLDQVPTAAADASREALPTFSKLITETPVEAEQSYFSQPTSSEEVNLHKSVPLDSPFACSGPSPPRTPTVGSSIAGSTYHGVDLDELFAANDNNDQIGRFLRRSHSAEFNSDRLCAHRVPGWWPRNLSFSVAEESILTWDNSRWSMPKGFTESDPALDVRHKKQRLLAEDAKRAREALARADIVAGWVEDSIAHIRAFEELCDADVQHLDGMYYPRLEAYQRLRVESQEALAGGKTHLTEMLKDVEVLGAKLEYEINALKGKVEDVEEGVDEFARQVGSVEDMVVELERRYREGSERGSSGAGWMAWAWSTVASFGTRFSGREPAAAAPSSAWREDQG